MNDFAIRHDKIKAEFERCRTALIKATPHLTKGAALGDKTAALIATGKTALVNHNASLIEVIERRIDADGSVTERYTRIEEVAND